MVIRFKHPGSEISILRNNGLEYLFTGVAGLFIYVISTYTYGLGVTNDSIHYINAALTLNEGMKKADGSLFCEWPPLYPLILSLASLLKINILKFTQILHGAVFIANILLSLKLLKTTINSKEVYISSVLFLLFSIPLLQMHVLLWSESIFILLILINTFALKSYLKDNSKTNLLILVFIGMLMYLQRKTGIYFILNTALIIFLYKYESEKLKKIAHTSIYLMLCSIPVILWQNRLLGESGVFLNNVGAFMPEKIFANIQQSFNIFSTWFLPHTIPLFIRVIILTVTFICVAIIAYKNNIIAKELLNNKIFFCCLINFVLYTLILIATLTYIHLDEEIDDRIFSPAYLPFLIVFFIIADKLYIQAINRIDFKRYFTIGLFVLILYPAFRTFHHINRWNTSGTGGYNTSLWQENQILTALYREKFTVDNIYTNNIYAMKYFLNYKLESNYKIFPQAKLEQQNKKSLYVCFEKEWNYPEEECINTNIKKNSLVKNKDGQIWQLTNQ